MNYKTYIFLFPTLLISGISFSGNPDLQVVNSSGGAIKGSSYSIVFNVGEVVTNTISTFTMGYLQPTRPAGPLAVTSVSEDLSNQATLFPNPATSEIGWTTSGTEVKKVVIFAASGIKVMEQEATGSKLNIEGITPGLYYVELMSSDNSKIKRFKIIKN